MSRLVLYTDGASKGNPGEAGIGVVVASQDGTILREVSEHIGAATNNEAEYAALIRALREAADLGAAEIEIATDSELLARQLTGTYKVKAPNLKPLHAEATVLLSRFARVQTRYVPREMNVRADRLANQAVRNRRASGSPHAAHEADLL